MPSRAYASLLRGLTAKRSTARKCVNALTGLCLIATVDYVSILWLGKQVSMPSRAYASLLQYPFKNLGFMRFPEPVFAGICQNILTVAHFHACLQFGHIL